MHSLDPLFFPASVALIGASSDPERIGGRPLRFLLEGGFGGALYPVNRSGAAEIQGLVAYASLRDVPGPVEHAIIAVPVGGSGPLHQIPHGDSSGRRIAANSSLSCVGSSGECRSRSLLHGRKEKVGLGKGSIRPPE